VLRVVPGLPRAKIQVRTSAPKHMRSAGVGRDVGNSYLCGRLAAPPIWNAIRAGAGGIRCDVLVYRMIELTATGRGVHQGPEAWGREQECVRRTDTRRPSSLAPWSARESGDADMPLLREDVVKGERGKGGGNGEQRASHAHVEAPALLLCPVVPSMSTV
jgi:hypothetical protein